MKGGVEISGSETQGGSRCAPLPWAIFSLPLRGGSWSLLTSAIMRFRKRDSRGFLFVYFAWFAVTFPAQWHGRPSLRVWSGWPEMICERMNVTTPKIARANAGERSGFAGKSRVVLGHRRGVAQLQR